ncbi:MAG: DNA-directed RNA polymerase subunit alpha [Candidatus Vogelbacteria bacterium]|nr:DNA-directed RNA polymerase subunit alpha [Candidatus Vogelbacteria bacterium]
MPNYNIVLPSKPRIVSEEDFKGVYEIDGLYPGYGHTLGNSLRRIILSSIPGAAITSVKIAGVDHEFSSLDGVKEDVITMLLNLKKVRFKLDGDEPQKAYLSASGAKKITAGDIETGAGIIVLNKDLPIATLTEKSSKLDIEFVVEKGLGFVSKEAHHKDKVDIGTISVDAIFTPIRRVNYEVENMRVGDRTDYNRLRIVIETDGTLGAREALETSIYTMIMQLKAVVGFVEEEPIPASVIIEDNLGTESEQAVSIDESSEKQEDVLKMRIEDVGFSARTLRALSEASIRTIGGLARKREEDLRNIDGLGDKGIAEIRKELGNHGITLK